MKNPSDTLKFIKAAKLINKDVTSEVAYAALKMIKRNSVAKEERHYD